MPRILAVMFMDRPVAGTVPSPIRDRTGEAAAEAQPECARHEQRDPGDLVRTDTVILGAIVTGVRPTSPAPRAGMTCLRQENRKTVFSHTQERSP